MSEPTSRKISKVSQARGKDSHEEKSLNKLLVEAKKQLENEKEILKRKVRVIPPLCQLNLSCILGVE